ncbi:MAG: Adenylate kinase [candidate division TM6 bacterium GW2011_GWF2_43_17]|nr:MAG: Adenylate kinase [candidate division TM6 bacterium GW2011_GWF2_43_17]HAU30124.1 adenylate kinase [Candidatus Dependentiae bacterium]
MNQQLVVLMGPPGSGKGTVSQMAVERLPFEHVSIGNLLKWQAAEGGELGQQIDLFVRSGKLVPDNVVIDTVRSWLLSKAPKDKDLLLDGFPRTRAQAVALTSMLQDLAGFSPCMLLFELSDEEVARRLTSRRVCSHKQCGAVYSLLDEQLAPRNDSVCDRCGAPLQIRSDDTADAVRVRLKVYHEQADALKDYYQQHGVAVARLNVLAPVEDVFDDFVAALRACSSVKVFKNS